MYKLLFILFLVSFADQAGAASPLLLHQAPAPHINGPKIYGCRPGNPFLYRIPVTGDRPMTFSASNLPPGLRLDKSTGIITGTIATPGAYTVLLEAANKKGRDTRPFRIVCGDRLALTPPMGWNDWYAHYGRITDKMVRDAADRLISSGMADAGYQYVNIDDCWANAEKNSDPGRLGPPRDAAGNILPNSYFPDMKGLTRYIHGKGLKAGIYTSPGPATCAGFTGSFGHEAQDASQFAAWGFDFLKYDYCSYGKLQGQMKQQYPELTSLQLMKKPYAIMGDLLKAQKRDILLNLCQYGRNDVWRWGAEMGQSWRTGGDLGVDLTHIFEVALRNAALGQWNGPGAWNDPDYIQIGYVGDATREGMPELTRLTPSEQSSFMSLWCLLAAPLFYSGDLTRLNAPTLDILCNTEAIDVDQDPVGQCAKIIQQSGDGFILVKDLEDGSKAIGFCNKGTTPVDLTLQWTEAGIQTEACGIRDLWRHKDLGTFRDGYSVAVPARSVLLVKATPAHTSSVLSSGQPGLKNVRVKDFLLKDIRLKNIVVEADKKILNPILHPGETAALSVRGIFTDGTTKILPAASVRYTAQNKLASGHDPVVVLSAGAAIPKEGGISTITAVANYGGTTVAANLDIVVRPYYRDYHQTLVLKLFMGMEGIPVDRLAGEPPFNKPHDVLCTFAQALDVIRKTDNLTQGIPKIIYLVGWQKGGHDHLYPSWDSVNPRLKREGDTTALQSLRWLIRAARSFHTTVSLHINMVDAYRHSPLWDEYLRKDVFARDSSGRLLTRGIQIKGDSLYIVSYTREWEEGLAQQRIDRLIAMVPELKEGHTIHIDAFIARADDRNNLSPWHAMQQHGGIDMYREAATQHKIFRYWRSKGFDVTGEGIFWAHPPGEGFYGLQPMSWWYPADPSYEMATPEYLSARGGTDRHGDGDFRFGNSIHGEEIYMKSIDSMPGLLGQFCRNTLPWYYLSRLDRVALINDTLFYSDGVQAAKEGAHRIIRKGKFILRDNDDLFVPALWKEKEIIAYSRLGYNGRAWLMPEDWQGTARVDIYRITLQGLELLEKNKAVTDRQLVLSLGKEETVAILPSGDPKASGRTTDTLYAAAFGIKPDTRKDMTAAVQQLVEQCRTHAHTVLVFKKGRYDFWPDHSTRRYYFESNTNNDSVKNCATLIKDLSGLTIDGRGSSFIYHGRIQPFTIDSSNNVLIKNIRIDWDIPLTSQAEIIDTAEDHVDLKIDPKAYPFVVKDHQLVFTGEGWEGKWWGSIVFDKASHLIVPRTADEAFDQGWKSYQAEEMPGGLVRLHGRFKSKAAPGNILIMRHSERHHAGIFITGSSKVRLDNIHLFHAGGLGILSQYSEDLFFRDVQVVPNAARGRYFSGHDDGMHFSNCKGSLVVDHCRFQGLMDDPINVHGTSVKIIRIGPGHQLQCRFMHSESTGMEWGHPGDSVGLLDHTTMQTIAHNTVTGFSRLSETDFLLQLSQPLPEKLAEGDALENLTWTPDLTIRNCTFGSNRARGILVTTPGKVRIENNSFSSSGSAILIAGDANYWFESGAVKDVLIRHNVFLSPCLTSVYGGCEAIISIDPEIPRPGPVAFHRNIRIEDNVFHPFDYPVLYAKSTDGLSFRNNTLIRSHAFEPFHPRKHMLTFVRCGHVTVKGNKIQGKVLGQDIVLREPLDEPAPAAMQFRYTKGDTVH